MCTNIKLFAYNLATITNYMPLHMLPFYDPFFAIFQSYKVSYVCHFCMKR